MISPYINIDCEDFEDYENNRESKKKLKKKKLVIYNLVQLKLLSKFSMNDRKYSKYLYFIDI